jgi:cation-transporting P-type ATPase E
MKAKPKFYIIKFRELGYIIYRNLFLFTNGVIFSVVILLFVFGDNRTGLFLGAIFILNISLGLFQDIRAWVALEKLQMLTTPKVIRLDKNGKEELITTEEINKDDQIKLRIGDQVPCDGVLLSVNGLELNEGLITGESNSLVKLKGDRILAGSVITAGAGIIRIVSAFTESRIARMTEGIRKHSVNTSPIQQSVALTVKYFIYILIASLIYAIIRSNLIHEPAINLISDIGTLTSMFVPQGLIFAVTLFFAYGAIQLFYKQVLLQEVNATEKLGRIKYLCMDKTGTLTQNKLSVETMLVPAGIKNKDAEELTAAYVRGTADSSEIILAIKNFLNQDYSGEIIENLMFSSWRRYGAVRVKNNLGEQVVIVGLPDIFLSQVSAEEKKWLQNIIAANSRQGKRLLCVNKANHVSSLQDIVGAKLSIVAVFVFQNDLRPGIRKTINFFQNRGVSIKIISGDNPKTAQAIATTAGIKNTDKLITGKAMEKWEEIDYKKNVKNYTIFAGIVPEQKEKIVAAFKTKGFTAMVGDGANDALAIKKANLGIAMFDGAPATRQLASVVLMNNSFAALPGGVELADNIIRNIEIFASIFLNQSLLGLFSFIFISLCGYQFPFTPLNITLINYFTVGFPGLLLSYWTLWPQGKVNPTNSEPFLKRILPFSLISSIFQAIGVLIIFFLSPEYLKVASSNTLVVLAFIILGFIFFICAPAVYQRTMNQRQKIQIAILGIFEIILLFVFFKTDFLVYFFNIIPFHLDQGEMTKVALVLTLFCGFQFVIAKLFISARNKKFL